MSPTPSMAKVVLALLATAAPALAHAREVKVHPRDISVVGREKIARAEDLSWRDAITFSPAHQNPSEAPALPVPGTGQEHLSGGVNNSMSKFDWRGDLNQLARRAGAGPLYCHDGPCIDGSCCGKDGVCGYGPACGEGCTSQCDATAMCGEHSEDANVPCGMKLCCSSSGWCGTTDVFCHNADEIHGTLPCQAGYGSCAVTQPPSCGGSSATNGRMVGYYQSWNTRDRHCDTVSPAKLKTDGFTHLFYSFAFIDPNSFALVPAHPDDETQMLEFTKLSKTRKLETWIAVGGYDFSNEGPTHTTWSDMVATKENRKAFIDSAAEFMDRYGFTGIDIDWEYPGDPKRGGRKMADTRNLAQLVREMRQAYGSRYGISLTLAPDYWYLRWFDAKAMESSVDFFGFMAYDLHGFWDEDVKTLGKIVRGQADVREIRANTIPLWFDGLNPAKLNFGLAMYGRGYTLADPSCNTLGCKFSGPSKPARCTNYPGVMSLSEVKRKAAEVGKEPEYLPEAMMKQLTWDDQWIGFDDDETFAAKKKFADSMCFGGTMVWSIDFQEQSDEDGSGSGSGNGNIPIKGPGSGSGSGNSDASDHKNSPFREFRGCSPDQKAMLLQSWWDVVELLRIPTSLDFSKQSGVLEKRVFGDDVQEREGAAEFLHKIYQNIFNLYLDKVHGKILLSCEDVYQKHRPEDKQTKCANKPLQGGSIGGYAFAYSDKVEDSTIVMCTPYYLEGQEHLGAILRYLRKGRDENDPTPDFSRDPFSMLGKSRMLLHELTHLAPFAEANEVVVLDQPLRTEAINLQRVYGPKMVEQMGRHKRYEVRHRTQLNADSLALYATYKYFEAFFGTPNAVLAPRGEEEPYYALNIILEYAHGGVPQTPGYFSWMKWLFFSVDYGTASQCQTDPIPVAEALADKSITQLSKATFPAGTFDVATPDGWCQYKNDGRGNPGALWCGEEGHSCRAHEDKNKGRGADKLCAELGKKHGGTVEHRAIVVCEW